MPASSCGRKLLLGDQLDAKLQSYVKALRSAGNPIGSSIMMGAASGTVSAYDRTFLVEYGGHISISKTWALALLKRLGYVKRKATMKSTPALSGEAFELVKIGFLKQIASVVKLRQIPDSLILKPYQTGIKLAPSGGWTMAAERSRRVEVAGLGNR